MSSRGEDAREGEVLFGSVGEEGANGCEKEGEERVGWDEPIGGALR
jgi:hypothetical protein